MFARRQLAVASILGVRKGQVVTMHAGSGQCEGLDDRYALDLEGEVQFHPDQMRWVWAKEFPTPTPIALKSAEVTLRLRQDWPGS